ncbi:Chromosome partition protein Smc [Aliiroseovarius sp. xm-v-201]|nr:Chromosome partition protein Smc [Aliiroseovarius sp. xm-m-354]NRQ05392.1 Chromosome partition protein Smc [Aliiroseovarius sp. xm-m-309]NRQ08597.1 Chromosome partition protein Smc [Aliiroseovarius sp. xm-v-201]NRQ25943.1 Chromosome partition protein Smc [Aliiroseovarius sp. xm-g-7]
MRRILSCVPRVLRRTAFLLIFVVLILGSNILLLTADAVYDAAKRGLWSLASVVADVGTPTTHRGNREALVKLTAQTEVFEAEAQRLDAELRRARNEVVELGADNETLNRRAARLADEKAELDQSLRRARRELTDLSGETADLTAERARLSRRLSNLEVQVDELDGPLRERVSAINERLARRTSRMISTNTSSMAIEAVPYVGVAAIVGVTFMEVRDACLTLADTREMSELLSGEPEAEVPACGYSPAEFWDILAGGPDAASCRDLSAAMPAELRLDCTTILRPGEPASPNSDGEPEFENVRRPGE